MQEVNEQASVDRAAGEAAAPAPAEQVATGVAPAQAAPDADQKLTKMSWLMVGAGVAIVLGSFLPWVTTPIKSWSGVTVYLGWLTLIAGVMLGLYGAQGLRKDDPIVRHHGWAITAVSVSLFFALLASSTLDSLAEASAGAAGIGAGLWIVLIGSGFAIWPLVQLRKDGKRRQAEASRQEVTAMASQIAGQTPSTAQATQAQSQEAEELPPADWYADPTSRHERRYFDGTAWTEHVVDGETQATDPIG